MVQQLEQFVFVADLPIGDEDNLLESGDILIALEGLSQGGKYVCSSVGREALHIPDGFSHGGRRHGLWRGEEGADRIIELNHIEAVLSRQSSEGRCERSL